MQSRSNYYSDIAPAHTSAVGIMDRYPKDEMERLQAEFPIEPCPVYQSKVGSAINYTTFFMKEGQIYKRQPLFINGRHQRLLFVHLNSKELIPKMLQVLDDSILWCDEKRDLGFIMPIRDCFKESYPILAWSKDHKLSHTKDIYNELKDFNSYEFKVGTNLYSHHMLATKLTKEEGYTKTNKYKDYWGYEYSIIEEASKQFNFNFKIINPADGQWGKINEKTGKWTGVVGDVIYNTIDIAISAFFKHFLDAWHLMEPFTSQMTTCAAFYIIANLEQRITGFELKDWAVLKNAFWYVYGTYIGESITRDTKSKNAFAVRCVVAVWLYYSFILLSAYGGELKAFLTNPRYTSPIETVKGVVDSGLPWGMVLYGEDEERIMAETTDPYLKRLWEEKRVMKYIPVIDLNPVMEEKMIKIDWKSGLEPIIFVRYSTSGGNPLVHKAPTPILMNNYCGWAFYPHNRWRETFDKFLQNTKEAGLVNHWIKRTWYKMKDDFNNEKTSQKNGILK
ncbi:unnamed protein product [Lepeophtheirus salmonis]|uniref:(salmon louse) hypothetical protein n=1 Tax=Lepeophtheirus salmonis TaxID=72036 RepID=A0A7R8H7A8_LEPSM|nr:unnamed protein product [Lepeophtheirus salmonis]CAF2919839.1 unnamed protein product [Lepeophtheirus salmonis]